MAPPENAVRWLPLFLIALAPSLASAWQPNGVRITGAPNDQQGPLLASDDMGGAFLTWLDFRAYPDFDLYLQHVTAMGQIAPGWPVDGLPVAAGPGAQFAWTMIPDGSGGVLVLYGD